MHLDAFTVAIFDPSRNALESGILHLSSSSCSFDSNLLQTDLLKLRYNANFTFESFCGEMLQQVAQQQAVHYQMNSPAKQAEVVLYAQLYELLA